MKASAAFLTKSHGFEITKAVPGGAESTETSQMVPPRVTPEALAIIMLDIASRGFLEHRAGGEARL